MKDFAGCSTPQVVAALGLTMRDLFASERAKQFTPPAPTPEKKNAGPEIRPVIEKIYSYENANGVELYQAIRMKPKSFRQRHKVGDDWKWNMDGVERVLYRLPQIMAALDAELKGTEKFSEPPPLIEASKSPLDFVMFLLSKVSVKMAVAGGGILAIVLAVALAGWAWRHHRNGNAPANLPPAVYQPASSGDTLPLPKK